MKMYNFCASNDKTNRVKRQPWNGRKYLQITYLTNNMQNIFSKSLTIQQQKQLNFLNGQTISVDVSSKEIYKWPINT